MAKIDNYTSDTIITGTANSDTIYNYADNIKADVGKGADLIINGQFFARGGVKVTLSGGDGDDTITNSGSNSIIDGGAGNDFIHNGYYFFPLTIGLPHITTTATMNATTTA